MSGIEISTTRLQVSCTQRYQGSAIGISATETIVVYAVICLACIITRNSEQELRNSKYIPENDWSIYEHREGD